MIRWWKTSAEQRPPASNSSAMPCPDRDSSGESSPKKKSRTTVEKIPEEAHQLVELLLYFKSDKCSAFLYQWMDLPRRTRKLYSYNGAIRCQDNSDPRHYHCKIDDQHYFDPTNWVYALAMRIMMPEMMKEVHWNNETKGDIFESILGCNYLVSHGFTASSKRRLTSLETHIGAVSAIFEAFAWFTHKLCLSVGHQDPDLILRWATWILDMVAWRQKRDSAVGTIVVVEDIDDYDFDLEPRTKCHALRMGN